MRRNKIIVLVMTLLLSLTAAAVVYCQEQWEGSLFSVLVNLDGGSETIKCWKKDDTHYVFLPGGADPDQASLTTNPLFPVWIAGERVRSGAVCGDFPFFEELPLSYRKWGKNYEQTVYFCQSADVPTIYIDTASGSMDYIHKEKGNAESGRLRLYRQDGTLDCGAQISAINGRGNSTWGLDKKPYSFELAQRESLLDMGAAKKWILLADAYDHTHMGNKMCYDLAAKAGCAYTPECQWVELYLNGNYVGLYLLSERVEVDAQRVDIPESGSFLISKERPDRASGRSYASFFSRRDYFYRIRHAGMEEEGIRQIWQSVEDAIFAEDGIDPRTGKSWEELIDVDSWARQYLICDSFMDCDAGHLSKFFYYDPRSDLVFAGPLWDMDAIYYGFYGYSINLLASGRRFAADWGKETMFCRLSKKDSFRQTVNRLYREEFRPLLLELAETGMDQYLEQIRTASSLNNILWDICYTEDIVADRKNWMLERIAFFDEYLGSEDDYCMISLMTADFGLWRSFAVRRGEIPEFLISKGITWMSYETDEPFDVSVPVTYDWVIYQAGCKEE